MHTLKARKRTFLLLALLLAGLTCTWAIASGDSSPAHAAAPDVAFEDLPEFAPKFQRVVARKRPMRHFALDRISCSWSGSRLCAHPAWL